MAGRHFLQGVGVAGGFLLLHLGKVLYCWHRCTTQAGSGWPISTLFCWEFGIKPL